MKESVRRVKISKTEVDSKMPVSHKYRRKIKKKSKNFHYAKNRTEEYTYQQHQKKLKN